MDLSGLDTWTEEDQTDAKTLPWEFAGIFSKDNLGLGRTSVVKHKIHLTDYIPFQERYGRIQPGLYEEVSEHL